MADRLHKVMAAAGIASRRKCEEIIQQGRVTVNGDVVRELGTKVDPQKDRVEVDGRPLRKQRTVIVAMNKPKGVVTTMRDERGRPTVSDLLPELDVVVKPVGRLDMNTEGLLLFTNDGELAAKLTHPKFGVWKTYRAVVRGKIEEKSLEKLRKGIWIKNPDDDARGRKTGMAKVKLDRHDSKSDRSILEISIHEGSKHQVRLMLAAVGHPVIELKRIQFGPIVLTKLPPGACRMISKVEEKKLRDEVR